MLIGFWGVVAVPSLTDVTTVSLAALLCLVPIFNNKDGGSEKETFNSELLRKLDCQNMTNKVKAFLEIER